MYLDLESDFARKEAVWILTELHVNIAREAKSREDEMPGRDEPNLHRVGLPANPSSKPAQ